MHPLPSLSAFFLIASASAAAAQWSPFTGQWGKTASSDLRIMTWNVQDGICSSNDKVEGANNWCALARVVAAMKPDVLILQECADNDGNGTGSGVDSVSNLLTTIQRFLHGGTDPFNGNTPVTAWVQKYAASYDLPFVFASSENDGFNRDVILSRYPFADMNGDGKSQLSDMPNTSPDLWAPGGDGGIRGFQHAEVNLPDATYAGNLLIGNSHLKAGSNSSDHDQRVEAAQNISYFLSALYSGLGTGLPDPHAKIADSPAATSILAAESFFVIGGDWNEDEAANGATKGPAAWLQQGGTPDPGANQSGADGPDKNNTDILYDDARDLFTNSALTVSGAKFDYLGWQDSGLSLRRAWVFHTGTVTPAGAMPAEIIGFSGGAGGATTIASDHRCVLADFVAMPALGCNTAASDLGYPKLGSNFKFPRFSACGSLAAGGSATLSLVDAKASAQAWLLFSLAKGTTLTLGGTLVPLNSLLLGPYATDASGSITVGPIAGGGGPFSVYLQWGIVDVGVPYFASFSNALKVNFLP